MVDDGRTRAIICGDRNWRDPRPIRCTIVRLRELHGERLVIVHGGCRGADKMAKSIAQDLGIAEDEHLAEWVGRPAFEAGHDRNLAMLALSPVSVVAFKDQLTPRLEKGGTEHMLKIALGARVPCYWYSHSTGWREITAADGYP